MTINPIGSTYGSYSRWPDYRTTLLTRFPVTSLSGAESERSLQTQFPVQGDPTVLQDIPSSPLATPPGASALENVLSQYTRFTDYALQTQPNPPPQYPAESAAASQTTPYGVSQTGASGNAAAQYGAPAASYAGLQLDSAALGATLDTYA